MPGACGIACEVCAFKSEAVCGGGCVPGTDPKAPERAEKLREMSGGEGCPVLECAIRNKVDYCLNCEKFPCDVHYEFQFPYSKKLLDFFKESKQKK